MSRTRSLQALRSRTARAAVGAGLVLVLIPLTGISAASAAPVAVAASVNLRTAASFSVLAGPSIANTGAGTVLALDLGVGGTLAGFPPGTVTGDTHINDSTVEQAQADRQAAYESVVAQTGGTAFTGDQAGKTYTPGLYSSAAAITNTGTITLDAVGDPNGIFVFQAGAALSSAASTKVVLKNGALANNVYWQVAGAVAFGANVKWAGTVLGAGAVDFGDSASLKGRVLTPGAVALANSPITKPIDDLVAPAVTINGGLARSTNDTTPSISGTTDEPGVPLVTVKIGSQVLTAHATNGIWTVSADALGTGPHDVVASVTDPSQNTGTATQVLTVDTIAPGVAITGGAAAATNDTTPTISGTTNEPGTPAVTVTVGTQTLTTTAGAGGAWTVDATALTETSHSVQASVTDDAGNTGTASQVLTVDVTVPVLTIDGGATRSTPDTSPWTYGTTAERAGTVVNLSLGGQSLTATVHPGGSWGVSAETLAAGTYTVLASITDAAGNTGSISQSLQIGGDTSTPVTPPATAPVTPPTTTPGALPGTSPVTPPGTAPVTPPGTAPVPANPPAAATYRPDAEIRLARHAFVGRQVYVAARQRVTAGLKGRPARTATFDVRITNRGRATDRMALRGTPRNAQFTVAYLSGRSNVTAAVLSGRYRTASLRAGQSVTLTVKVTKVRGARVGSSRSFAVRTVSVHSPARSDTVAAVVKVVRR